MTHIALMTGILCLIGLLACDSKPDIVEPSQVVRLDTTSHEHNNRYWEDTLIEADTRWRFLSGRETDEGFEVTGAWEIILRNTSDDVWEANPSNLVFEDKQGFQIAEYYIGRIFPWILQGHQTKILKGNFVIRVASIELANSISEMSVWASFKISD